ncbi:MAG: hypothetical protein SFU99_13765 [Saprospiraceae bacterium]|nr:hypothetical protein [Saprospiraceae bacterium]
MKEVTFVYNIKAPKPITEKEQDEIRDILEFLFKTSEFKIAGEILDFKVEAKQLTIAVIAAAYDMLVFEDTFAEQFPDFELIQAI